ncbi:MAG: GNAT family N-acetyltransferase [Pseudomonadota bacterium]
MSTAIRQATPADGPRILDLIRRTPQYGQVVLNFERDPDFYLGACVSCEDPDIWVAEAEEGPLLAVFNVGRRTVYVNGEPQRVRYAHDLRVDAGARGGLLLHRMFRQLRRILADGEWMQTVILAENRVSMETVGSGRAGLPVYYPCGEIETSLLSTAFAGRPPHVAGIDVMRATAADIPALQRFLDEQAPLHQFFPQYNLGGLLVADRYFNGLAPENYLLALRGSRIVGVLGDWDQGAFKKTRVIGYPGVLRWLRPVHNALRPLTGDLRLPAAGGTLRYRMLHTMVIANQDPDVLHVLLDQQLHTHRDTADALVMGGFRDDPLLAALRGRRRRRQLSRHYVVSYDGDPRERLAPGLPPYVDLARL